MADTSVSSRERRRADRHVVRELRGTAHLSTDAKLLNMSMTGMAVQVGVALPVGRSYSITFRPAADATLRLGGSVVWCRRREAAPSDETGRPPAYEAGLRFDRALGQRATDLARVLQAVSRTEVSRRISSRFRVDAEESVTLHAAFEFAARNVSAAGVLVEAAELPPPGTVVDAELRLGEHALRTEGRIARVQGPARGPGEPAGHLGIEFIDGSLEGREAISRFVAACVASPADEAAG